MNSWVADVMMLTTATTVAKTSIKITVKDGKVMIDAATVKMADILPKPFG